MERNNDSKDSQTRSYDAGNPDPSSPPDSSSPPPPPYVPPIPIPPRPRAPTRHPFPASLPPRSPPRTSTSALGQPEGEAVGLQQDSVPDVVQRGFHPGLVHRPPTPKPVYAEFGGRWGCKNENSDLEGGSEKNIK
ncbi:hypothetical protein CLAIMM_07973 [Cladophialophora immunda]|nr:hypothetical protein CLAIMM_07973 [Cladophialophora immunda]